MTRACACPTKPTFVSSRSLSGSCSTAAWAHSFLQRSSFSRIGGLRRRYVPPRRYVPYRTPRLNSCASCEEGVPLPEGSRLPCSLLVKGLVFALNFAHRFFAAFT